MPRTRFTPRPHYDVPVVPFINAEEAWFWFIRCHRARQEGARFESLSGARVRPCDPDDLYRAVAGLARNRKLTPEHVKILGRYGLSERPPDPRRREEERPARLWDEALDKLSTVLKQKGIIE